MNILVVDDHQLFLDGFRYILKNLGTHVIVSSAVNAEIAIDIINGDQDFDLILIDLNMPGMDGISILKRFQKSNLSLPVVVISAEENPRVIKSALDSGALGFIPKSASSEEMLSILKKIIEGQVYVPKDIQEQINNLGTRRPPKQAQQNKSLKNSGISKRQYEVLQLLARGYSNKQIASTLFLTEHTVKAHVSGLFNALKTRNRTECVQLAQLQGIISN